MNTELSKQNAAKSEEETTSLEKDSTATVKETEYRDLLPRSDIDLQEYEKILNFAMDKPEIRNVAVAGAYGSGKSSIVNSYEKKNPEKKFLHISLAHFSEQGCGVQTATDTVNLLEGKILNQLLHQIDPNQIPDSNFPVKAAKVRSRNFRVALFCTFYAMVLFYVVRFDAWKAIVKSLPYRPWFFQLDWTISSSVRVFLLVLSFLMSGAIIFWVLKNWRVQKLFKRIDVKGLVGVELFDDKDDSVFDKYLNDVLYLLEHAEADVIVFEDLDRYDVTQIFEKLRQISILLYQRKIQGISYQHKPENYPPKFFYLVRDDIFSSAERSKFFDLIIPIVPVVSTENSLDLLKERLGETGGKIIFDQGLLRTASLYLSDLRLINNIVNEYNVYQQKLSQSELPRTVNRQLAMIIYKNLYPQDFDRLHCGEGYVYGLFQQKQELIKKCSSDIKEQIQSKRKELDLIEKETLKSIKELNALFFPYRGTVLTIDSQPVKLELPWIELVDRLLNAKTATERRSNYGDYTIDIAERRKKMEENSEYQERKRILEAKETKKAIVLAAEIKELENKLSTYSGAKLSELLAPEDKNFWIPKVLLKAKAEFEREEEKAEASDYENIIYSKEYPLLKYFIEKGFIDENYPIYISFFYENNLDPNDKGFIMSVTNHEQKPYEYALKSPETVFEWIDDSFFVGKEILNYSLFEYMLCQLRENKQAEDAPTVKRVRKCLNSFISTLEDRHQEGQEQENFHFIWELLRRSEGREELIKAINEAKPLWFDAWQEFQDPEDFENAENAKDSLLGVWCYYARDTLIYCPRDVLNEMNLDGRLSNILSENWYFLWVGNDNMPASDKVKMVNSLKYLNVEFTELNSNVPSWLLKRIYEEDLYALNTEMIKMWLEEYYSGSNTGNVMLKSYSYLQEHPEYPLSRRVEQEPETYMEAILNALTETEKFEDNLSAVLGILNHQKIGKKYKEEYIRRLATEIDLISNVDETDLWSLLIEHANISDKWENVADYIANRCAEAQELDGALVNHLNRRKGKLGWTRPKLEQRIGKPGTENLLEKLISCDSLTSECCKKLLAPIKVHYNNFPFTGLPNERVEMCIALGMLPVTESNIKVIRNAYPALIGNFAMQGGGKIFIETIKRQGIILEQKELVRLLEAKEMTDEIAEQLLAINGRTISIKNRLFSEKVKVEILRNHFDTNDIDWMIQGIVFLGQPQAVRDIFMAYAKTHIDEVVFAAERTSQISEAVYAGCIGAMTITQGKELRGYLRNKNFEAVCTENKKPTFPANELVHTILAYFQQNGWISSFRKISEEKYRAYPKFKK